MMKEYDFRVAGLDLKLCLPDTKDIDRLLPSFRPFGRDESVCDENCLFRFNAQAHSRQVGGLQLLEKSVSDLGHVRLFRHHEGYRVEVRTSANGPAHTMDADGGFKRIDACMQWEDPRAGYALCSLLRIAFSQAVIGYGGVSLHASAVVLNGKAYLFMGRSGTGKSTHAALWLRCFPGSELLNDDNPTIRMESGRTVVYGTPWSGKTPCYKDLCFPLGGLVRLSQAGHNRFVPLEPIDAFMAILPGCAVISRDASLHTRLCDTLVPLSEQVKAGLLECLPDEAAARLCAGALSNNDINL